MPTLISGIDNEAVSKAACEYFITLTNEFIQDKGRVSIVFPTGSSPKRFYELLVTDYRDRIDWSKIIAFGLDELSGIPLDHPATFYTYMVTNLFTHVPIKKENIHFLNGNAPDMDREISRFEQIIEDVDGIDITLLGVGTDGHIGMNFPGSTIDSVTRKVVLSVDTRPAASLFTVKESIPAYGYTIGIENILSSRKIILIADGAAKRQALRQLSCLENDKEWPVSYLKSHSDTRIFASISAADPEWFTGAD